MSLRTAYREAREPIDGVIMLGLIVGAAVLVFGGLAVGLWWGGVFASHAVGSAQITRDRNSASNREAVNTTLTNDAAQITTDVNNIKTQKAAGIVTEQDRMDLTGLRQNCATDVSTYNAAVTNILAQGLKPKGLPNHIDPTTTCES